MILAGATGPGGFSGLFGAPGDPLLSPLGQAAAAGGAQGLPKPALAAVVGAGAINSLSPLGALGRGRGVSTALLTTT